MGMSCGIIGLPNVGKSTIFNALTNAGAQVAEYAFCTIKPNHGVVTVPDRRMAKLAQLLDKKDPIPTKIEFVDVAGLIKGASQGEGLGNKFLDNIRNVDALIHVVRGFHNQDVTHITEELNPLQDIEIANTELMLADLEVLERAGQKAKKMIKSHDKAIEKRLAVIQTMCEHLNQGHLLRKMELSTDAEILLKELGLITQKPVLYILNVDENNADKDLIKMVEEYAGKTDSEYMQIAGKIEEEISQLEESEKSEYLKEMGIKQSGLDRLILKAYSLLKLMTFYTLTTDLQAWAIKQGTSASMAAGKIHTDFARGFIRAEVYHFNDIINAGTEQKVRERGLLRAEGKEYIVKDGDVIHFLFNV